MSTDLIDDGLEQLMAVRSGPLGTMSKRLFDANVDVRLRLMTAGWLCEMDWHSRTGRGYTACEQRGTAQSAVDGARASLQSSAGSEFNDRRTLAAFRASQSKAKP